MKRLVIESWLVLAYLELIMRFRGFRVLHRLVGGQRILNANSSWSSAQVCRAVDFACAFYFKQVLCLQRSAATTLVLRRHGYEAQLVIGAKLLPFRSHAWVEIAGSVVNDRPYMMDMYRVLERC